jgi:hypothetical protein
MLVKNYQKFLNLSKVINSSFGTEGAENGRLHTQSIKFDMLDDGMLKCRYLAVVNFGSDSIVREMRGRYEDEARELIKAAVKKIKEDYKEQFPDSEQPKFNLIESSVGHDVEFLTYSMYSGSRKAYYRFGCLISVE